MGVSEAVRSAEFRMAYWSRIEELVDLLVPNDKSKAIEAARTARLGRATIKRFNTAAKSGSGPLSLAKSDQIARRYAMWSVWRKFDWGVYPASLHPLTQAMDGTLTEGIYDVDVRLRRQIEAALRRSQLSSTQRTDFIALVQSKLRSIHAALYAAPYLEIGHPVWNTVENNLAVIVSELDELLCARGAISFDGVRAICRLNKTLLSEEDYPEMAFLADSTCVTIHNMSGHLFFGVGWDGIAGVVELLDGEWKLAFRCVRDNPSTQFLVQFAGMLVRQMDDVEQFREIVDDYGPGFLAEKDFSIFTQTES